MASRRTDLPTSIRNNPQTITPPPANGSMSNLNVAVHHHHGGNNSDDDSDNDEVSNLSEIRLFINTPLLINGDGNRVAIDPSLSATKIAMGIVNALKTMTVANGGIPMIDEEGHPRPVTIKVEAEVKVTGSKNIVGERAVLNSLLKAAQASTKLAESQQESQKLPDTPKTPDSPEEEDETKGPKKRERDRSELAETEAKRTKVA